MAFSKAVLFGSASPNSIETHYIRRDDFDSAEVTVCFLGDRWYHVTGTAPWDMSRTYGPNMEMLDFFDRPYGERF